jgi:hypothetical protein
MVVSKRTDARPIGLEADASSVTEPATMAALDGTNIAVIGACPMTKAAKLEFKPVARHAPGAGHATAATSYEGGMLSSAQVDPSVVPMTAPGPLRVALPTALQLVAEAQAMPESVERPVGICSVTQLVPPLVVETTAGGPLTVTAPPALQTLVEGQAMETSSNNPLGGTWVTHVVPPLRVVTMAAASEVVSPTAVHTDVEGHETESSS